MWDINQLLEKSTDPPFTVIPRFLEALTWEFICRVLSGSFDQTVGIWSQDGKLIQRLGPFISNITGLCYVAPIGVIWITNGTSQPTLYEPQSGEIVSDTRVFDAILPIQ